MLGLGNVSALAGKGQYPGAEAVRVVLKQSSASFPVPPTIEGADRGPYVASAGLYSCVASSPAGEAVLQYSVEVQAEELAGVQVASQGTTLRIDHVGLEHSGLFACQATNEAGTAGAEVDVSVHGEWAPAVLGLWAA
ncbi:hypothetical protein P7K49_001844 [Saguinus oedipus]|uniref:Ig-like domain-containing protein n=1 Tax=Saguinus oedipus TaxID=9490 RepID=A0ABQ9WI82_SAGOE|nr:hypothetical protein P7K49_001844 [Saguinus oedipus]